MAQAEDLKEEAIAIPKTLYDRLNYLGLIPNEVRSHNVGESDYSQHTIQPWSVCAQDFYTDMEILMRKTI